MLRLYTVEFRAFRWGEWSWWAADSTYNARSPADAIKQARAAARNAGWTRQDGKLEFRAKLAPQEN